MSRPRKIKRYRFEELPFHLQLLTNKFLARKKSKHEIEIGFDFLKKPFTIYLIIFYEKDGQEKQIELEIKGNSVLCDSIYSFVKEGNKSL